ncbi:MAG TPA: BglII/BstYI family type II restriction endonuclease, partial [bacterium]|nr:BglII/BstYI family type II restriction endonuclease [bacterium]
MKTVTTYFHCGDQLKKTLEAEINEVVSTAQKIQWAPLFQYNKSGKTYEHQTAYNKAFSTEFSGLGWEQQPKLRVKPRLIGDFRRGLVFVEIQFGNSSTLYRDYYKFQYGLANGLLSLAVLIVPVKPSEFFPTR